MKMHPRFASSLFTAFGTLAFLFVSSTLLANWFSHEIEDRFVAASAYALPSIAHLSAAGDALRDLEGASDDYPDLTGEQRAAARRAIEEKWHSVDVELTAYLGLSAYPGERALYESGVPAALREVNTALDHLFAQADGHEGVAVPEAGDREVRVATNHADRLLREMVGFNAAHAQDELSQMAEMHRRSARWSVVLDALAVLCGVPLFFWVLRRFREHDKLLVDHNALVEQRAAELEVFGQRVAHDLISPLSALTFCLGAFKRASQADPKLQEALARARGCVARAQGMVNSIFDFARAGGQPEARGRADLREVLQQVIEELREADGTERPEVIVEPFEGVVIACTPGVLASVLSNLLWNAVKYMSDSALKRIAVRVREKESSVRVEVEDSGPGIPRGLEGRIFEPYVRAEGVTQAGLGLGLATVRRLCEAHGGSVGVHSMTGQGSVFWFTLPKASGAVESTPQVRAAMARRLS